MFVLQGFFQRFGVCWRGNVVRAKQADSSPEVAGFQFAGDSCRQACVLIARSLVATLGANESRQAQLSWLVKSVEILVRMLQNAVAHCALAAFGALFISVLHFEC